jgi:hypothetical protein
MSGGTDLTKLLQELHPIRNEGEYVFCLVNSLSNAAELNPLCIFQEKEEVTVILPKKRADENFLLYSVICAWITLDVHSSLEAVGLTAAVAKVLTEANISCNVVAAYYHDHLFVPVKDAERAMDVLSTLSGD